MLVVAKTSLDALFDQVGMLAAALIPEMRQNLATPEMRQAIVFRADGAVLPRPAPPILPTPAGSSDEAAEPTGGAPGAGVSPRWKAGGPSGDPELLRPNGLSC